MEATRRHRTIEAPPAASPYEYLAAAAAAATTSEVTDETRCLAEEPLPRKDLAKREDVTTNGGAPVAAACCTAATSTDDDDVLNAQCQLMSKLYERRLLEGHEQRRIEDLLAMEHQAALLERAKRINAAVAHDVAATQEGDDEDAGDALERHLLALETRLTQRSERLRWGAVADEGHPSFDSRQLYHETVATVLEEKTRKAARIMHEEALQRDAANKLVELRDMNDFCREVIVKGTIVDEGLLVYELVREAQRDAEMLSAIVTDGERREAARLASDAAAAARREAREAQYIHCADPVLRQLREDAAARRAEEHDLAVAQEEAELAALEQKLEKLSVGFVPPAASSATNASRHAHHHGTRPAPNGRATRGSVPYWKRAPPPPPPPAATDTSNSTFADAAPSLSTTAQSAVPLDPLVEDRGTMTMQVASQTDDCVVHAPAPPAALCAPSSHRRAVEDIAVAMVPAAEVSTLLHIIDLAADDGDGRTGRGLALLLSGIDV